MFLCSHTHWILSHDDLETSAPMCFSVYFSRHQILEQRTLYWDLTSVLSINYSPKQLNSPKFIIHVGWCVCRMKVNRASIASLIWVMEPRVKPGSVGKFLIKVCLPELTSGSLCQLLVWRLPFALPLFYLTFFVMLLPWDYLFFEVGSVPHNRNIKWPYYTWAVLHC